MAPIVACTTFGLNNSTVSGSANIPSIPNQSAIRIMVPRLPGSRIVSRARNSPREPRASETAFPSESLTLAGFLTTASAGDGDESDVILAMTSVPISSSRHTFSTSNPDLSASATIFSPSTTNTPLSSLNFFCDRERRYFISLFDIPLIFL